MSEHTPGKLVVRGGYSIYADVGTMPIADACVTASKRTNEEANARRLVAAWNACDLMPTEDIERLADIGEGVIRLVVQADEYRTERDSLRALNSELLEALEEARRWIGDGDMGDGMEREIWTPKYTAAVDMVDAAIASARKQGE